MAKEELAAYLIMESPSDPVKPENIKVCDQNNLFYVNFDTVLQRVDSLNRNNRSYVGKYMDLSLAKDHLQELIRNNTWMGESGHPDSEKVSRILTIDPNNISHRINRIWREGDLIKGNIDTLDDGSGPGMRMTRNILQGMEPAFSLRAMAGLTKKSDGTALMQSVAHIVTYDRVILPSHREAYRDRSKETKLISRNSGQTPVHESAFGLDSHEYAANPSGILIPVVENSLMDFIQMESTAVNLVSNVCEVAMESMSISPDLQNAILKESGRTYIIPLEEHIKNETRSYMSKFF